MRTTFPPHPSGLFETVAIDISVDASCGLVGGSAGDDLTIFGEVDLGGGDVRSGTLLTGEVLAFGFEDGPTTDLFDFRFAVTGGLLADLYVNEDIGALVQSENSTFAGNCSADSTGQAKGTLGSIAPLLPAEGCTPGYWKQKHHFDSWQIYDPLTTTVADAFGPLDPSVDDLLLKDALRLKGGGLNALMRHAVAALLNAASSDVSYNAFTDTSLVIAATQAAVASGDYEPTKDAFEEANEEGCPLN